MKPLRDKYRVGTSSAAANPVRIANISNNATVSQADQTAIINSLTFTETVPNRSYARASANEITSKTVSNVSRTGNNAMLGNCYLSRWNNINSDCTCKACHSRNRCTFALHCTRPRLWQIMVLVHQITLSYLMVVPFQMRRLLG